MRWTIYNSYKVTGTEVKALEQEYLKRLKNKASVSLEEGQKANDSSLLKKLKPSSFLILLDETGELCSSTEFSKKLQMWQVSSKEVVFAIGGPSGWGTEAKERANQTLSLSKLTFPNQLVRLILLEQLYRACCITSGHPYHK